MNRFVIHKHHARQLHYDLRLEKEGVLKSWAIPKEPPEKPGVRRLAIQVEDHSLSYIDFEGTIPKGMYGAGKVEIWDKGTYTPLTEDASKLEIQLEGGRLKGKYVLVKFKEKQ